MTKLSDLKSKLNIRMSLMVKLIIIFIGLTLIPLILIGILSYSISYNVFLENTTYSTAQIAGQLNKSIDSLFTSAKNLSDIGNESNVRKFILEDEHQYENAKEILKMFTSYRKNLTIGEMINNIYLIGNNGKQINDSYGVYLQQNDFFESIDLNSLFSSDKDMVITTGNINQNPRHKEKTFIYVYLPLIIKSLREPYGAMVIELKSDIIQEFCDRVDIAGSGFFSVFDKDGQVVFGRKNESDSDREYIFSHILSSDSGNFSGRIDGNKMLFVYNSIPQTDWKLVGQVALHDLMRDVYTIRKTVFSIIILLIVFATVLYLFFTKKMILPLKRLNATMRIAALGDMSVRFVNNSYDEIQDLGESFNLMIIKLDNLAKQNIKRQVNLQKAELDLLQAQINPHFLYNTLDTILWQSKVGNNDSVIEMVDALGNFFRMTLSKGKGWITVSEELEIIKNYLKIQKNRYGDLLEYEISADESLMSCYMLKLTLQPIVENAIYHGIKNKRDGGKVWIRGYDRGDYFEFQIQDDGVGMTSEVYQDMLDQINLQPANLIMKGDSAFGIKNVHSRIKLYYGDDCGLTIKSTLQQGTTVTVRLRKEGKNV